MLFGSEFMIREHISVIIHCKRNATTYSKCSVREIPVSVVRTLAQNNHFSSKNVFFWKLYHSRGTNLRLCELRWQCLQSWIPCASIGSATLITTTGCLERVCRLILALLLDYTQSLKVDQTWTCLEKNWLSRFCMSLRIKHACWLFRMTTLQFCGVLLVMTLISRHLYFEWVMVKISRRFFSNAWIHLLWILIIVLYLMVY